MCGEEAERKLYVAARTGDVLAFQEVLNEDPHLLLASFSFLSSNKTPLHIATMHGMSSIVEMALDIDAQLALDLDSTNSSPLHMAAAQGSLEIVKKLLSVAPETRWWRDCHDMNPVHIAAMKGHVEVLKELLELDPFPAMERVHRGQTMLHLCVKHGQLPALKVLVEKMGDLVRAVDDDGETVLHLAVRCKQLETVRYLVETQIDAGTKNSTDETALDILNQTRMLRTTYKEMKIALKKYFPSSSIPNAQKLMDTIMVVMILIATMAFQAAVSPPGGVWQDDGTKESPHGAGEAVMASTHPKLYLSFLYFDITAFVSSIVAIILLVCGWVCVHYRTSVMIVLSCIGLSIWSITSSFGIALVVTAPKLTSVLYALEMAIFAFCFSLLLLKWCAKAYFR